MAGLPHYSYTFNNPQLTQTIAVVATGPSEAWDKLGHYVLNREGWKQFRAPVRVGLFDARLVPVDPEVPPVSQ